MKSSHPKKIKMQNDIEESTEAVSLYSVQALTKEMEEQTELLKKFEKHIQANMAATKENKEEIIKSKEEICASQKQNLSQAYTLRASLLQEEMESEADRSSRERGRRCKRSYHCDIQKSGAFEGGVTTGNGPCSSSFGQKEECCYLKQHAKINHPVHNEDHAG